MLRSFPFFSTLFFAIVSNEKSRGINYEHLLKKKKKKKKLRNFEILKSYWQIKLKEQRKICLKINK